MGSAPAAVAVGELKGVGPKKAAALAAAGVHTVGDLLCRLPRSYQDRSAATPIGALQPGQDAVVAGRVLGLKRGRRGRSLEIAVEDGTGSVLATWFRPQPWMKQAFSVGAEVVLMGRLDPRARPLRFTHPEFEAPGRSGPHRGGVVPLYDPPEGFGQRALRALMHQALEAFPDDVADPVPPSIRAAAGLMRRGEALRVLHFPDDAADVSALADGTHPAHEALLFEDLFVLQVALARRRRASRSGGASPVEASELAARGQAGLPFSLTPGQEDALGGIRADLASTRPMLRLLQGDVGAGKTIVALLAACDVLAAGLQVAVLAPTSVLAMQWLDRATAVLGDLGLRVALLTGATGARERREILAALRSGEPTLLIGTHALIQEGVELPSLGLAIIDEQHRFGVFQRAALRGGGHAHLLAMTATPIPRSLALTLYGDLDLSLMRGRPPRGRVLTERLDPAARPVLWPRVRAVAERGERAYVVCPRVDGEGRAVLRTAEELAEGPLAGVPLGVLHGRMPDAAKAAVLARFAAGELRVLVTTTVVEVGVDVPEATFVVVEDADRFGLAQLHQLRGRVGRSERGGTCVLVADPSERLELLVASDDGFELAEQDLRLRGPGDLVGGRQTGTPAFALWRSPRFVELLGAARDAARSLVQSGALDGGEFDVLRQAADARLPRAGALESS